jgi:hypothetical protein
MRTSPAAVSVNERGVSSAAAGPTRPHTITITTVIETKRRSVGRDRLLLPLRFDGLRVRLLRDERWFVDRFDFPDSFRFADVHGVILHAGP